MDSAIARERIEEAKERIGDKAADMIAELLHMEKYNPVRKIGCCPNPAHDDKSPSCSWNPKARSFYCFGCHSSYDLIDAWMANGDTFLKAVDKLFTEADMPHNFSYRGIPSDRDYVYPRPDWADNKEHVYEYWQKRCISPATIDALGIMEDKQGNTCFCYWDESDVLRCVKVRPSRAIRKGVDKQKCWWLKPSDTMPLLWRQNCINVSAPLIICCGEGDCASAYECGFSNATSIPYGDNTMTWVSEQWSWLEQFSEIVLVHDNDEAGRKFIKEATRRLGEYRCKVVDLPETYRDDDGIEHSIKDLNEYLFYAGKRAVIEAINNAKAQEIESVIDYADVSSCSMTDVEGMYTGLKALDEALDRIYAGTLNVITGIAGSGKSSFLSTLINQALDQGFPTFVYSGELNNALLKNWVSTVAAGQANLTMEVKDGRTAYHIKPECARQIDEYYRGLLYLFKDTAEPTATNVLNALEASAKRYNCRVGIIDNMTALDLESTGDDRWTKQDAFVRRCVEMARRLDLILFVVLHPRKQAEPKPVELNELSGVTSSANLAHRVFSLYRIQDSDREPGRNGKVKPYMNADCQIRVIKDRFASAGGRVFPVFYDPVSRRFYDSPESLAHRYAWDKVNHEDDLPYFDLQRFLEVSGQGGEPF